MSTRLQETALSIVLAKWNTDEAIKERNRLYDENKAIRMLVEFARDQNVYYVLTFKKTWKYEWWFGLRKAKGKYYFARSSIDSKRAPEHYTYYHGSNKSGVGWGGSNDLAEIVEAIIDALKQDVLVKGPYYKQLE